MKNNSYSLQILNHKEIFNTREAAIEYIDDNFKPDALLAEPAIVFYGETKSPNIILAFGSGDKRVFTIDSAKMVEDIQSLTDGENANHENIESVIDSLKNLIDVCGLTYDDNKKVNQISYNPDPKDLLIADAETLSKAIDVISKYVQKGFKENKLSVTDTKTIRFSYADNTDGGKTLKAAVNISTDGEDDDTLFNNNIIGVKSDGIFASVDLEYDETRHELTFSTSGIRNNRFVDDANKKVIPLGEHKQYDAVNTGHTVKIATNKDDNTISADVKISEDETNILDVQDGMLFVDGRAKNIKYKGTTVYGGINSLENSVAEIQENIEKINDTHFIEGNETDTMSITAEKTALGYHKISGDVRLGNNKSIKIENGGLVADVNLEFDNTNNTLYFKLGNDTKELKLNGIDLVEQIYYDASSKEIVVVTKAGQFRVSVSDLFKTWEVDNKTNSPIELVKTVSPDAKVADKLSANIRLASTDNLLEVVGDKLIAKESKITNAVEAERQRAIAKENEIKTSVDDNKVDTDAKIEEVKGNVTANANAITAEQTRAEAAEAELKNSVTTVSDNVTRIDNSLTETIGDVDGLAVKVQDAESKIAANETNIANNTSAISQNVTALNDLKVDLSQAKKDIESHIKTVDIELGEVKNKNIEQDTALTSNASAIASEKDRAIDKETELKSLIDANKSAIELEKTDRISADEALKTKDADLQAQIDTLKTTSESSVTDALAQAKAYTDAEVEKHKVSTTTDIANAKREAIDAAALDASTKVAQALTDAKEYTDVEKERAMAAEGVNKALIDQLTAKDIELENNLKLKIEKIEIVKDSVSDLQYIFNADGKKVGEINIPKDQFLKDVTYNEASKELEFSFVTSEGEKTTKVNIADLVDTYTAGNGLNLNGNEFSVKLSAASEGYLTLDENGLKLSGIDAALTAKANSIDVYTKADADGKFLTEHQSLENLATKEELGVTNGNVTALAEKVTTNESKIITLTGNEATDGSVANAVKVSKEYSDAKLAEAKTEINAELDKKIEKVEIVKNSASDLQYLLKVDGVETSAIDIPTTGEGLAVKEGKYVAKVDSASEEYLSISAEGIKVAGINAKLDEKANIGVSYTKEEADSKFLTEHQDITGLATKEEVNTVNEKVAAVETSVSGIVDVNNSQNTRLANLESENVRRALKAESTNTVNTTVSKNDDGTVISSEVRLKNSVANILKSDAEGIFANVTFDYNKATNTISFSNGIETHDYELSGQSLVTGGTYDNVNKLIVLTIQNADGTTSDITIPVGDLVDTFEVENTTDNPIQLTKSNKNGVDVISASLNISTAEHNAIIRENGALYASKDAKDMTALWGSVAMSIQAALNEIKGKTDTIDRLSSEVDIIKTDLSNVKSDVNNLNNRLTENEGKINDLESDFRNLNNEFTTVKSQVNALDTKVSTYDVRIKSVEDGIKEIKDTIGTLDPTKPSLEERLSAIEEIVNNLIDFGFYDKTVTE